MRTRSKQLLALEVVVLGCGIQIGGILFLLSNPRSPNSLDFVEFFGATITIAGFLGAVLIPLWKPPQADET